LLDESSDVKRPALFAPALAPVYERLSCLGYVLLRVTLALMFLTAGIDKLFLGGADRIAVGNIQALGLSYPYAWGWTVAGLEFFGAILLGIGLFTRPVAFALAVELTVIAVGIMSLRGFFWTVGGMEVALLMGLAALAFVFGGDGRFSVDRWLGKEF
jgi:putative oxidoreductase